VTRVLVILASFFAGWLVISFPLFSLGILIVLLCVGGISFGRAWWQLERALKLQDGFCMNCGYDLRATPDRCPECGTDYTL
jgi:hypothetical protein